MHVSLLYYACVLIYDACVLTLLCVCPNGYILVSVQASKEPADAEQPASNNTAKKRRRKATSVEHAKEPTAAKETAEAGAEAETVEVSAPKNTVCMCPYSIMRVSLLYHACVLIYDACVLTLLCVCPNGYILVSVQASKKSADAEQPVKMWTQSVRMSIIHVSLLH